MKWCNQMNMWCQDMDDIDIEDAGCDGECSGCESCEDVTPTKYSAPLW